VNLKDKFRKGKYRVTIFRQGSEYKAVFSSVTHLPDFKRPNTVFELNKFIKSEDEMKTFREEAREEAIKVGILHVINLEPREREEGNA